MKVVVINGTGGCGKDTFVQFCENHINNYDNYPQSFHRYVAAYSTVDDVKKIAKTVGWDGGKTDKDRHFLADLKDLLENYNHWPSRMTDEMLDTYEKWGIKVAFVHCREPEYIKHFVEKYNAYTLLIRNPNVPINHTNHADGDVEDYNYDEIINNDGTLDDLKPKAIDFIEKMCYNVDNEKEVV